MATIINGYRYRGLKVYADRHGRVRYYERNTGQALPDPADGFREFDQAYWRLVNHREARRKPAPVPQAPQRAGTIEKAVREYLASDGFKGLAAATRVSRANLLGNWAGIPGVGGLLVATLRTEDIQTGMRNRAATPPTANNWLVAVRALMDHCIERKWIKANPTVGVKRLKIERTGGFPDWAEADVAAFEARWPAGTPQYLALQVLLAFGQRRSDAVRFSWDMVDDAGMLIFEQQKTGKPMRLPMPTSLGTVLPARSNVVGIGGEAEAFLLSSTGKPFTASYFTNWFHAACIEAGLPHLSTHGTRKLAAKRLRKAGCPLSLIMAFTGHKTEAQLRVYLGDVESEEMAHELRAYMRQ